MNEDPYEYNIDKNDWYFLVYGRSSEYFILLYRITFKQL